MNNNPLRSETIALHQALRNQITAIFENTCVDELKRLEAVVQACNDSIAKLYSLIPKDGFESLDAEILFFKIIKPLFLVEREYCQRLYHGKLFTDDTNHFWYKELNRMDKLLADHHEFVTYYHNGETNNDHAWFSQGQPPLPTPLYIWPIDSNLQLTSARDSWVAGLIAVERYREWLLFKIDKCECKR